MITLYSWQTPNPKKVVLLLEELGMPYNEIMVDPISEAVRSEAVLGVSPNGKIPAILDDETDDGAPLALFESGAILIYLAEKAKSPLLPASGPGRARTLQWLMWQMAGIGPMIGQYFHFTALAPEKLTYPIARYQAEMHRLLAVLEAQLAKTPFVAGDDYTIADIAIYPWVSALQPLMQVDFTPYPSVSAWMVQIAARPATARAYVSVETGSPA
jgi:GST-like protein